MTAEEREAVEREFDKACERLVAAAENCGVGKSPQLSAAAREYDLAFFKRAVLLALAGQKR